MRAMRHAMLITVTVLAGCAGGKEREGERSLATDTALAADLREIAADTSLYSEAADVAMRDVPDSTLPMPTSSRMTTKPAAQVGMRATTPGQTRPTPIPVTPPAIRPAPGEAPAVPVPPRAAAPVVDAPVAAPSSELDAACSSPATADQRRCLLAYLARSDVTLTRRYQARIADMKQASGTAPGEPEPPSVQRLRAAQRAWLVYRDTECRNRNRGREGPLWAATRARCLAEFSAARADELAQ